MGAGVGFFLFWYFGFAPALIVAMIMQPRALIQTPFFRIFVRGHDEKIYSELRRPWPNPKPGLAQRWQKQYMDYVRTLDVDPSAEPASAQSKVKGKKGKRNRVAGKVN
mmetsp:Transcript_5777/g.13409  ORF Transcript_5777/g.13409 Transcript_5777/m.13409 type:complete len:108 (+) Transcript_5777:3-326(+)